MNKVFHAVIGHINHGQTTLIEHVSENQLNNQTNTMNLNDLAQEIYENNKAKGFWPEDKPRNVGEMLMLVTSELGEAMEAHRKGRFVTSNRLPKAIAEGYAWEKDTDTMKRIFEETIKDGFSDEIADAIIRLFDMAGGLNIDIDFHIRQKLEYNKTRERLHGKKY
jgi:NTP pyrophosphatase (non-canonical NTP hydrolase)